MKLDQILGGAILIFTTLMAPRVIGQVSQLRAIDPHDLAWVKLETIIRQGHLTLSPSNLEQFNQDGPLNRDQFAYLLNLVLTRIEQDPQNFSQGEIQQLKQLQRQFARELALFKADVDTFEARLIDDNATKFSPTSSLKGYGWLNVAELESNVTLTANTRFELLSRFEGGDELITQFALTTGGEDSILYGTASQKQGELRELFYRSEIGDRVTMAIGPQVELSRFFQINPFLDPINNLSLNDSAPQNTITSGAIAHWSSPHQINLTFGLLHSPQTVNDPDLGLNRPKIITQIAYELENKNTIQLIYNELNPSPWRASFAWHLDQNLGIFGSYDRQQWQAGLSLANLSPNNATLTLVYQDSQDLASLDTTLNWPINDKLALIPSFYLLDPPDQPQDYGSNFKLQWEF